jgi:hypothetical protein
MTPSPIPEDRKSSGGQLSANLSQLLSRVEEAQGPDRELDRAVAIAAGDQVADDGISGFIWRPAASGGWSEIPRLTSSLDAALALVERVRPDAYRDLGEGFDTKTQRRFWLATLTYHGRSGGHSGECETAPIALLAALLRALISQQEEKA